jgi:hypothetical protein
VYLHCLKCIASRLPYTQCEYANSKDMWIKNFSLQVEHVMQKYFLCNLAGKLQNNFRFYNDDMKRLLGYCEQSNIDVNISDFFKKFKAFFAGGQKLSRSFVDRTNRIFRSVCRLFLTKVNFSDDWYFIYRHPEGDCPGIDRSFAMRDKQLTNLMKSSSLNSSCVWNTNSLLMMRLGYTNTHGCRIQCKDRKFVQYIMGVSFAESSLTVVQRKKRERVCSRLLFMNYRPSNSKHVKANYSNSVLQADNPTLKEVLEFEENCHQTYNQIEEAISRTNIKSIVKSFFNFLCLEIQMMTAGEVEDKVADMLRVDLPNFNHEERVNLAVLSIGSRESIRENLIKTIIDKGYFKGVSLHSTKDKKTTKELYRTFTYNDFDTDMGKMRPLTMTTILQSNLTLPDFDGESAESYSSDDDQVDMEDGKTLDLNYKTETFIEDDGKVAGEMIAILIHLDIHERLEHCTLRYYYSLDTQPEQMADALLLVKRQIKECCLVANKIEVLNEIRNSGAIPKRIKLQEPSEFILDKKDFVPLEESTQPPRRKQSEVGSSQGINDLLGGYMRDPRLTDRKQLASDLFVFDMVSKKEFEFPELITGSDTYKTSIFASVKSELVQSSSETIHYLPKLSTPDAFFFIFNNNSLIKVTCSIIEKEPQKMTDPRSSFNEAINLASSIAEQQPKKLGQTSSERKEKIVLKMLTLSFYSTEEIHGDFGYINSLVNSLLEKNVLDNFRRFIRRMGSMRADSTLAKYFLSEEPREFRFHYPKVNDKTNFLFLLKNNLHLLMSRVTGTIDDQMRKQESYQMRQKAAPTDIDSVFDMKKRSSSFTIQESLPSSQDHVQLQPACMHHVNPTSTDSVFFFNYTDANVRLFGPVLFFLNIIEQNYDFKMFSEFMGNDGQYTTLVRESEDGHVEFDSLQLQEGRLTPQLSIINGIKHIRYSKDPPIVKGVDRITFHVSSRYLLFTAEDRSKMQA